LSCKKDNRIERNLWKQGGEWNIELWSETTTSSYYEEDNNSTTFADFGTFKFNKDGTGSYTLTANSESYTESLTYQNTENTLTIFDPEGDGRIYDLDWERNDITLSIDESKFYMTDDPSGGQVAVYDTHQAIINLKKK